MYIFLFEDRIYLKNFRVFSVIVILGYNLKYYLNLKKGLMQCLEYIIYIPKVIKTIID